MKKTLCKILIVIVAILCLSVNKVYAVIGKEINKQVTNWNSGGFTGWTEELKEEAIQKILRNLKKDFEYKGSSINNEMGMKTTISIEDKHKGGLLWLKTKYKIRIRNRNRQF